MKLLKFLISTILIFSLTGKEKSSGAILYISVSKPFEYETNGLQKPTDFNLLVKDLDSKKSRIIGKFSQGAMDPCISSEGKTLIFSSNTYAPGAIFSVPTSGGRPDQLSDEETSVACPALSPNNKKIVYAGWDKDEQWNIHLMNVDASRHIKLTNSAAIESFPAWSSDGTKVLFHKKENDDSWHIYSVDTDGENLKQLTEGDVMDWLPSASPDGKHIAFWSLRRSKNWEIFLMDIDGNNLRQISNNVGAWVTGSNICQCAWTPDSQKLIFCASGKSLTSKIMVLDISTGEASQLSGEDENYCYSPVWVSSKASAELFKNAVMSVTPTSFSFEKR